MTTKKTALLKFEVRSRWTGDVQFVAEIAADDDTPFGLKLALAVKWALKSGANLRSADLSGANLRSADLRSADLRSANLRSADLSGANLSGANLRSADLRSANLSGANLSGANLRSADLRSANLSGANLRSANLSGANLRSADLRSANLRSADLRSANLSGAVGAELAIARTRILSEGDIIGWKKCQSNVLVKLLIPTAAPRSHAYGRKCRAGFVDVLEVFGADKGVSMHDGKTEYVAGQRVTPDGFDPDWRIECGQGIHFYISKIEAEHHC